MDWRLRVLAIGVLAACHAPACGGPRPPAAKDGGNAMSVDLDWTMTATGGGQTLHIDYTVTNRSPQTLYLLDQMLAYQKGRWVRAPGAIIVRGSADPAVASLYLGFIDVPMHDDRRWPAPGMRALDPGQSLTGSADTPLPLATWSVYRSKDVPKFAGTPTRAVLEVQILKDRGIEGAGGWRALVLGDGTSVDSPYPEGLPGHAEIVATAPKPLP